MTTRNIAVKNIKGNLNKYIMYYLSNVIVVTIFFIFANFIFNPAVNNTNFNGNGLGKIASELMYMCEFVIIIFTIVFSRYSITNFLKSREKEFGLLAMFGLTKRQIRSYVMFENIIISIASIITGLFFGILFSKLFFLAVASVLDFNSEIPFEISFNAIKITTLSFLILFNIISYITSFKIKNNNIAQLLKGARIPKKTPKFSIIKAMLAIILIVGGYITGISSKTYIFFTMFPILIAVIIGTNFLFSQFSVFFTDRLKNNKLLYYRGINMITLSQIVYKLKDNAKVLFITAILSGITLASAIAVYSLQVVSLDSLNQTCPQDIGILEQGVSSHKVIPLDKVEAILKKYKFQIQHKDKVELLKASNAGKIIEKANSNPYIVSINKSNFNIISQQSYNELAKQYNKEPLNIKNGEIIIYSYDTINGLLNIKMKLPFGKSELLKLKIQGKVKQYKILDNIKGGIINADRANTPTAIVSDNEFKNLWNNSSGNSKYIYYGYNINHYLKASAPVSEIKKQIPVGQLENFTEKVLSSASFIQILSIILFIGTFVAAIFFIANGSILYFKMFNEIQKDKQEFIGLKKIGVTHEEIKKIISVQSFIMFFLPLVVALLHAAFAVKSLGILYTQYFAIIAGLYIVLQIIYYLFAKWMYVKQINSWV